jgi:predicted nucleic acid-binding protein
MIVVSDTSPITSLLQTGHGELLPILFGKVLVPTAVEAELLRFHVALPDWLRVQPIVDHQQADDLGVLLDRGEAEAIVLAEDAGRITC